MRIVYLNPCGTLGGAETSLRELLASVRKAAPEWELWLILGEDGPLAQLARNLQVRVEILPFPGSLARLGDAAGWKAIGSLLRACGSTALYAGRLWRRLRQIQPDIIHTNGFKMHLLGAWTRPGGSRLVWHLHDYVSSRRMMSRLLRPCARRCSLLIVNSNSVANDAKKVLPQLRSMTLYNATNLRRFSQQGPKLDLDELAGLAPAPSGTIRVGLVATFARWKGHTVFLEALARLPDGLPVRGYVIGGPIYQTDGSQWSMEELQGQAARLGLNDRLGFTGFIEDTAAAMRSLDIVVHASTAPEPFGMVIIEAMACSKPVIVSKTGGAAELFIEGENALGHVPGDASALAAQIARLVSDAPLRHRLGAAARVVAEQRYQGDRLARELLTGYRTLCSHFADQTNGAPRSSSVSVGVER